MNYRGCSGEDNRLSRTYYAGETNDLDHVIRWLHLHNSNVPLFAVGYSLDGNMRLKLLGQKTRKSLWQQLFRFPSNCHSVHPDWKKASPRFTNTGS